MAVEIQRFLAWIAAHSLTEFTTNCVILRNALNEGHAQKKTTKKVLDGFV
jgi:hypothetical protein